MITKKRKSVRHNGDPIQQEPANDHDTGTLSRPRHGARPVPRGAAGGPLSPVSGLFQGCNRHRLPIPEGVTANQAARTGLVAIPTPADSLFSKANRTRPPARGHGVLGAPVPATP